MYSVISLLDEVLGDVSLKSKGNRAYYCPFCNHHKKKLEVHPHTGKWNCWVCNARGLSIFSLFKKISVDSRFFEALKQFKSYTNVPSKSDKFTPSYRLPSDFTPLYESYYESFEAKRAKQYLLSRGVTQSLIKKYKIGYCPTGEFKQRVVIPSYSKNGQLNFFTSRAYRDNTVSLHKNSTLPKDIVFFESYVNFDENITLTEAVFDAISFGKNTVPLLGKFMSKSLKKSIISGACKVVYICLDPDAYDSALLLAKWILQIGKTPVIIKLLDKDPNETGRRELQRIRAESKPVSELDLLQLEIGIL